VDLCSVVAEDLPAAARVVHAPSPAVSLFRRQLFFWVCFPVLDCRLYLIVLLCVSFSLVFDGL
jgi:hypothetical protein